MLTVCVDESYIFKCHFNHIIPLNTVIKNVLEMTLWWENKREKKIICAACTAGALLDIVSGGKSKGFHLVFGRHYVYM